MKRKTYFSDESRLRMLLERFEAGLTDNREERRLFAAFAPGHLLPADLEPLRPMMAMYAAMAPARRRVVPPAVRWLSAGVAACLLAVVGFGYAGYLRQAASSEATRQMYAGSYVIRNGVRYTDPAAILGELEQAERIVGNHAGAAERAANAAAVVTLPDGIDMDDPRIRAVVESALGD